MKKQLSQFYKFSQVYTQKNSYVELSQRFSNYKDYKNHFKKSNLLCKNIHLDLNDVENMEFIYKDDYKFLNYLKENDYQLLGGFMRFNLKLDSKQFFMENQFKFQLHLFQQFFKDPNFKILGALNDTNFDQDKIKNFSSNLMILKVLIRHIFNQQFVYVVRDCFESEYLNEIQKEQYLGFNLHIVNKILETQPNFADAFKQTLNYIYSYEENCKLIQINQGLIQEDQEMYFSRIIELLKILEFKGQIIFEYQDTEILNNDMSLFQQLLEKENYQLTDKKKALDLIKINDGVSATIDVID